MREHGCNSYFLFRLVGYSARTVFCFDYLPIALSFLVNWLFLCAAAFLWMIP